MIPVEYMKANGLKINAMDKGLNFMLMEILTQVTIKKVKQKAKVYTHGEMEKYMMVSLLLDKSKAVAYGKV